MIDLVEHSSSGPPAGGPNPAQGPDPGTTGTQPGGILLDGPFGKVAATLLRLSDASSVSVFVHNDYAPEAFREIHSQKESWVVVGSAAAADALTLTDVGQFRDGFCREYYHTSPGACRYEVGKGRTGQAIENRRPTNFERTTVRDHLRSEYHCEVKSPNAMLIVPATTRLRGATGQAAEEHKVIAAVRFLRTEERRRAKFLAEEQQQLATVVSALSWLVPAWSEQNALVEFKRGWHERTETFFSTRLRDLIRAMITNEAPSGMSDGQVCSSASVVERAARAAQRWVAERREPPPRALEEKEVKQAERSLLAWLLDSLDNPRPASSVPEIVSRLMRALITVHWGPAAAPWIDKLDRLERFEPVLAEIPRYRDHSVHQFQVFLIGWLILRNLEQLGKVELRYLGWSALGEVGIDRAKDRAPSGASLPAIDMGAWVLASLFHDVAYPLQHVITWANHLGRALTDADQKVGFVQKVDAEYRSKDIKNDFWLAQQKLKDGLQAALPQLGSDSEEEKIQSAIEQRLSDLDHGVWSAIVLLHTADVNQRILRSAVAIALHTMIYQRGETDFRWQQRIELADPSLGISFLLLLCDALHEWGRNIREDEEGTQIEAALGPRPSLVDLSHDGQELTIDIALGSAATGSTLRYKIQELQHLARCLAPGGVGIKVRVARGRPVDLDTIACQRQTVRFGPT